MDPFFLDLEQLDAVDRAVLHGGDADLTRWGRGVAHDTFAGSTVCSIVLSVPVGAGDLRPGRRIATWSTSRLATDAGVLAPGRPDGPADDLAHFPRRRHRRGQPRQPDASGRRREALRGFLFGLALVIVVRQAAGSVRFRFVSELDA